MGSPRYYSAHGHGCSGKELGAGPVLGREDSVNAEEYKTPNIFHVGFGTSSGATSGVSDSGEQPAESLLINYYTLTVLGNFITVVPDLMSLMLGRMEIKICSLPISS